MGPLLLLGWTMRQWALVAAHYQPLDTERFPPTLPGALRLQREWRLHRGDEPGGVEFVGVEPVTDWDYARQLFHHSV